MRLLNFFANAAWAFCMSLCFVGKPYEGKWSDIILISIFIWSVLNKLDDIEEKIK